MSEYFQHYNNIDILLVPLETSDFNRVKSPLKVVECAFSHTGIVASEFGPYTLDLKNAFQKGGTIDPNGNFVGNDPNMAQFIVLTGLTSDEVIDDDDDLDIDSIESNLKDEDFEEHYDFLEQESEDDVKTIEEILKEE